MIADSVFISHSSMDRPFVEKVLLPPLQETGVKCWYSPFDILSAEDWERSILKGLESTDWILIVMTPHAQVSEWVRDEVMWAVEQRAGRIVPILAGECDPRAIHIRLARIQHIDFRSSLTRATDKLLNLLGVNRERDDAGSASNSLRACRIILMCQHFSGHKITQFFVSAQIPVELHIH